MAWCQPLNFKTSTNSFQVSNKHAYLNSKCSAKYKLNGSGIGVLGGLKKHIGQASPDRSESKYFSSFNLQS